MLANFSWTPDLLNGIAMPQEVPITDCNVYRLKFRTPGVRSCMRFFVNASLCESFSVGSRKTTSGCLVVAAAR